MIRTPSVYTHQKKFWTLSALFVVLVLTYLSLVGLTVSNTVARQRAEQEVATLQASVSELEFAYVSLTSSMTLERAREMGMIEVADFSVARSADPSSVASIR